MVRLHVLLVAMRNYVFLGNFITTRGCNWCWFSSVLVGWRACVFVGARRRVGSAVRDLRSGVGQIVEGRVPLRGQRELRRQQHSRRAGWGSAAGSKRLAASDGRRAIGGITRWAARGRWWSVCAGPILPDGAASVGLAER